jgi:Holliday junction resolvase
MTEAEDRGASDHGSGDGEPMRGSRLKKLARSGEVLDSLDLFVRLDNPTLKVPVDDPARVGAVIERFRRGLGGAFSAPSRLYGWQVQVLFKEMVAALGDVALLKDEDVGDFYFEGEQIKVPDYFVATRTGRTLLIEVKNCRSNGTFSISSGEMMGLRQYQKLARRGDMRHAVYWSKWNMWTLIDPANLTLSESRREHISLGNAVKQNDMDSLGDFMVGTTPPLTFTVRTDLSQPHHIDEGGMAEFTIGGVEFRCAGRVLEDKVETRLAWFFMLYGSWPTSDSVEVVEREVRSISFEAAPQIPAEGQDFQILGPLSSMFSARFNAATLGDDSAVRALGANTEPGLLGALIPEGYRSTRLPLWRIRVQPTRG